MGVGLVVFALFITLMQGVFCQTWSVWLPQTIVAISGSCVTVPCRFTFPSNEQENILNCSDSGVWRKRHNFGPEVITEDTQTGNKKVDIVGDITKGNCTTVFLNIAKYFEDSYFFRLNCPNSLKYSFMDGVNISVQGGAPPPVLTSVKQVSEGDHVRLQCSAPVPCPTLPPSLTWFPRNNSMQEYTEMQQTLDRQVMMMSTLTFIASADHQNQDIGCSVSYPLTEGGNTEPRATTQRLSVLYAPRFTVATLSVSGPVSEGRIVILTCSSEASPPVSSYTWYKANLGELIKKGEGEILGLRVSQKDSGVYLCEAYNRRGSQKSRPVILDVRAAAGSIEYVTVTPYIICGFLLVLYILIVVVDACKYKSLSRRLKQIELKGEHTYADLRTSCVTSDYDQLQTKTTSPPEDTDYENTERKSTSAV